MIIFETAKLFSSSQKETSLNGLIKSFYDKHHHDMNLKMLYERKNQDEVLPPYLRKRLKRFKSIHKSMHAHDYEKQPIYYGNLEYLRRNEIPDISTQVTAQTFSKWDYGLYKDNTRKHHHSRSHQRIKKVRSKPEAGIMQKIRIF